MPIHGIRIYPQSVEVIQGHGAPIFLHGSVKKDCSDFFYIFSPLASRWRDHYFVKDFSLSPSEDPLPDLERWFGEGFVAADVSTQLMLLRGDDFLDWGARYNFQEGALLPIFRERPSFDGLERLYWDPNFRLTPSTWPAGMRAILNMWDDFYWELYSTEPSDLDLLLQAHEGDAKLKMYFVDLKKDYPMPSDRELPVATLATRPYPD